MIPIDPFYSPRNAVARLAPARPAGKFITIDTAEGLIHLVVRGIARILSRGYLDLTITVHGSRLAARKQDRIGSEQLTFRPIIEMDSALAEIASDIKALLLQRPAPLGIARPPAATGVYILTLGTEIMYVGEAKGRKGLKDRLTAKHISGDDSHAIQRAFKIEFPDRVIRRDHIKKTVLAQWLEITPDHRVSAVERILIWMFNPPWNVK